jgi:hypothetical protein
VRLNSVFIISRTVEYEEFKTFSKKNARKQPKMMEEYFTNTFSPSFTDNIASSSSKKSRTPMNEDAKLLNL